MSLEYFANDKYKVLSCMADRQIAMKGEYVVKLSQQDISDILGMSKVKVNLIISELKAEGYLVSNNARGKYQLTEKANVHLADMKNGGQMK